MAHKPESFLTKQKVPLNLTLNLKLPDKNLVSALANSNEGHNGFVDSVSLHPDGRFGLSGSFDETLRLWDLMTGRCLNVFEGHTGSLNSVFISAD